MRFNKEKDEGCSRIYDVLFAEDDYINLEEQALLEVQKMVVYPGFRKGKVPFEIIKKHFYDTLEHEIKETAVRKAVGEIIERERLNPIVPPSVYDFKNDIKWKRLSFKVYIEVSPAFEPKGYTDFEVCRRIKKITDKDVDRYIDEIREYNAYLKPVDEPVSKDKYILVDYQIYENSNKVDEVRNEIIDMSSPQLIIGFDDVVIGARKGEKREFETEFNGRKLRFVVEIKDVKVKVVPELDENFIKQLGAENIDDLKKQVKRILENEERIKSEKDLIEQIENKLIENNNFPLPPTLVREEMEEIFEIAKKRAEVPSDQELDIKNYEGKLKPIAERNLRIAYILHAISRKENIVATEEDYIRELDKVISTLKNEEEIKKAKELFESRKSYIMATITENKTMDFIKSKIRIKEEIVE